MRGRRALILSRDDLPEDKRLVASLRSSGCHVAVRSGSGYAAMMSTPDEARPSAETGRAIVAFLTKESPESQLSPAEPVTEKRPSTSSPSAVKAAANVIERSGDGCESIFTIEHPAGALFGILSKPAPGTTAQEWCVLLLNPGAVRHIGPNRMWVEAARRWAARGVTSLRLDLQGIGESDGDPHPDIASLYQARLVEQIEIAMEALRSRIGVRRFVAVGLCSGAFWAFHGAIRNADIPAGILMNPRLFFWDPEVDRRRLLRRTVGLLTETRDWRRLLRGYVSFESFRGVAQIVLRHFRATRAKPGRRLQIPAQAMADAWAALDRNQCRLTLIFTEGEPLLREMEEERQLPRETGSRVRCIRIANCGHTFRPLWAQKLVHELMDRELDRVLRESPPASTPAPMMDESTKRGLDDLGFVEGDGQRVQMIRTGDNPNGRSRP
jgi:pimeloyl-ACP methyl ester carboxylesterase